MARLKKRRGKKKFIDWKERAKMAKMASNGKNSVNVNTISKEKRKP